MKFVNKILIEMLMVVIWTKLKPDEDFQYERLCFEIRSTTFSLQIVFDVLKTATSQTPSAVCGRGSKFLLIFQLVLTSRGGIRYVIIRYVYPPPQKKKYRPSPSPNGLKAFTFLHAIWLISTLISTRRVLPGPYAVRQGRWGPCGRLYHHLQIARRRAMNHSARHCVTACAADASAMSRSRIIWKCTQAIPLLQTAGVLC